MDFEILRTIDISKKTPNARGKRIGIDTVIAFVGLFMLLFGPAIKGNGIYVSVIGFIIMAMTIIDIVIQFKASNYTVPEIAEAYDRIAAKNGWHRTDTQESQYGGNRNIFGVLRGTLRGCNFEMYEYMMDDSYDYVVMKASGPWELGQFEMEPVDYGLYATGASVQLEGNFNNVVSVKTDSPPVNVLKILTPDVMQSVLNVWPASGITKRYKMSIQDKTVSVVMQTLRVDSDSYISNVASKFVLLDAFLSQVQENMSNSSSQTIQ